MIVKCIIFIRHMSTVHEREADTILSLHDAAFMDEEVSG